jgi:hypothetical protein
MDSVLVTGGDLGISRKRQILPGLAGGVKQKIAIMYQMIMIVDIDQ